MNWPMSAVCQDGRSARMGELVIQPREIWVCIGRAELAGIQTENVGSSAGTPSSRSSRSFTLDTSCV
ncbi:hypothetical protein FPZ12_016180 [Amycolatopsis acidicola]|uniref:Uncharacterized protein n=1 Tax=Amycolatopsis acidicola TaxID=2596893 RepID=A0A5N0V2M5_9PSEU|nr:hypothetical protein FPZ12_016180 [Amycolatopsis acidicola]